MLYWLVIFWCAFPWLKFKRGLVTPFLQMYFFRCLDIDSYCFHKTSNVCPFFPPWCLCWFYRSCTLICYKISKLNKTKEPQIYIPWVLCSWWNFSCKNWCWLKLESLLSFKYTHMHADTCAHKHVPPHTCT